MEEMIRLEQLRKQLDVLVAKRGTLVHPEVIELSQEMDQLVLTLQKLLRKRPMADKDIIHSYAR